MANIVLKTDFKDGQFLYGDDLNNNFRTIEAGVNANEDNLQDVINQAQEVLRNELVDITTDRGWDWEEEKPIGTRVSFFKGNTQQLEQHEARPGQLLYNVETGETYLEEYGERIVTGSGNTLVVSEEEPTNPGTKVWINPKNIVPARDIQTYPIGSVIIFSDAADYSNYLNMKWQLIDQDWIETYLTEENMEGVLFEKNENVSVYDVYAIRTGKTLRIRLSITTAVPITDTKIEYGKLNPIAFGTNSFVYSHIGLVCGHDVGNGIVNARVSLDGVVTSEDFVSRNDVTSLDANTLFIVDIYVTVPYERKLDSTCNKFYWKRIG